MKSEMLQVSSGTTFEQIPPDPRLDKLLELLEQQGKNLAIVAQALASPVLMVTGDPERLEVGK